MFLPREPSFPYPGPAPKVVPEAPTTSYAMSVLSETKEVCEVKIISPLGKLASATLPVLFNLFIWEEKKKPAPGTSGCSSGSIHSPP